MRDELQRWLDGELADEALPEELRPQAERLRGLLDTPREVGPAPSWIETRVMSGLPERRARLWSRVTDLVLRPRTIQFRPVTAFGTVAAAVLVAVLAWPSDAPTPAPTASAAPTSPAQTVVHRADDGRIYVQFVYVAPDAGDVAVAGDFNQWDESGFTLRDPDGDGVWTGRLPLSQGLHKYMFVVDGEWVTDPLADRYVDDGFGNRNALIDVNTAGSAT